MPVFSLDRIIVTENIEIAEAGVHHSPSRARLSDHLPDLGANRQPARQ